MKKILKLLLVLLLSQAAYATNFSVASYNMQGWVDTSPIRQKAFNKIIRSQNLLKNVSVLMVQESIENIKLSTAQQLAKELGWERFSEKRVSDGEGLGFIYPRNTYVTEKNVLQLKTKDSVSDFSRMAMTLQIDVKNIGRVRLVNTHLAHLTRMSVTRRKQLNEIVNWVESLEKRNPSELVIFGGDFNTGPNESYYAGEFQALSRSSFKFKLAPTSGENFTWIDQKTGRKKLIDLFFVSLPENPLQITSSNARILAHPTVHKLSDHNLVILDLNIQRKK